MTAQLPEIHLGGARARAGGGGGGGGGMCGGAQRAGFKKWSATPEMALSTVVRNQFRHGTAGERASGRAASGGGGGGGGAHLARFGGSSRRQRRRRTCKGRGRVGAALRQELSRAPSLPPVSAEGRRHAAVCPRDSNFFCCTIIGVGWWWWRRSWWGGGGGAAAARRRREDQWPSIRSLVAASTTRTKVFVDWQLIISSRAPRRARPSPPAPAPAPAPAPVPPDPRRSALLSLIMMPANPSAFAELAS